MAEKWREAELPLFSKQECVNDPERALALLAAEAKACMRCPLYKNATQTVFGEGPAPASLMLVGEQPGDQEDLTGRPFVGPAGMVLDHALESAGIDRADVYVTNAVKHFKFSRSANGRRRIHQTPDRTEVVACRPWLLAEFAQLAPRVVVALGATAGQALLGPAFRVTRSRGRFLPWPESAYRPQDFAEPGGTTRILATLHPSAVLRADDRDAAYAGFLADLRLVAGALA